MLSPELLGALSPDASSLRDELGVAHLLALGAQLQGELARASREAAAQGKRISTLAVTTELRDGRPGRGRRYRLTLGCYPIPPEPRPQETGR